MNKRPTVSKNDLIILVADKNMEAAIQGLLQRHEALGIPPLSAKVFVHPYRDPGVLNEAHEFLAPFTTQYARALVMFDREGSGRQDSAEVLGREVQSRLDGAGWIRRSAVIVLDPELETWVWSDSPHVPVALRLSSKEFESLRAKYQIKGQAKPSRPKDALEEALFHSKTPRSSSIYYELAKKVTLARCNDQAFLKLKSCLREWFPRRQGGVSAHSADA
jgi:hypothetical protein